MHEQKCLTVVNELLFQNEGNSKAGRAVTKLRGCTKKGSRVCCLIKSKLFRKYYGSYSCPPCSCVYVTKHSQTR